MGNAASNDGYILRADLNGDNVVTIVEPGGTYTPKQLKLDAGGGKLYWSDREGISFIVTAESVASYRRHNRRTIRLWSLISLAPHSYLMAICGMFDRLGVYLWLRLGPLNLIFVILLRWQRAASRGAIPASGAATREKCGLISMTSSSAWNWIPALPPCQTCLKMSPPLLRSTRKSWGHNRISQVRSILYTAGLQESNCSIDLPPTPNSILNC